MSYSKEFMAGWAFARSVYQNTNSVPPRPPEAPDAVVGASSAPRAKGIPPQAKGTPAKTVPFRGKSGD